MIKLNYNNIIHDLLPPTLRNIINFQWLQVLIKPIKYNWDLFWSYYLDNDYEIKHQSQIMLFEQYLNHHVDTSIGDITIGDGSWRDYIYFWNDYEIDQDLKKTYFSYSTEDPLLQEYFFLSSEYGQDDYDFIVDYYGDETITNPDIEEDLKIWIEKLRNAGTTYIFREK